MPENKDLNFYKKNCEEDYIKTPISVLRYISELEKAIEKNKPFFSDIISQKDFNQACEKMFGGNPAK